MKIWCRTSKGFLSYGRSSSGGAISYDGVIHGFNALGVDCVAEYPAGNALNAIRYEPPGKYDYLHLWYGDPSQWVLDMATVKGRAAYCRCGEAKLPSGNLERCDLVLVPTESLRVYHQAYLQVPVGVMFGGYKPALFPERQIDFNASPFIFLHAGSTQWRKGSDKACAAFVNAFPREKDVRLVVRSPGATPMFKQLQADYARDSRIIFDDIVVTDRREVQAAYYSDAHCLVYPSIIEGAGRHLTEAMATGLPSLVADTSSMRDYFSEAFGWWVATTPHPDGHRDPDVRDMAEKFRQAYEARDECSLRGHQAAAYALSSMTWEAGILEALPSLERLYAGGGR